MAKNHFDEDYVTYWKQRVGSTADGSKVADQDIADFYIKSMEIAPTEKVLDLGCGHGRFFPTLSKYSTHTFGVDVTFEAINAAAVHPYSALIKGTAESTNFAEKTFNKVIAWGVFDVVDQEKGFAEVNRILKKGGLFLVTGKNNNYEDHDSPAFIAERNAKLKDFPNHFTDVLWLLTNVGQYGFEVMHAFAFKKRGDLGENKFILLDSKHKDLQFYEFVLIVRKVRDNSAHEPSFCYEFSKTAFRKAVENDFKDPLDFFKWHKANSHE